MSRVYIKNLPVGCSEHEVRALFRGFKATITDIQLKPERRIAFVGFYDTDFNTVRQHFDRAYIRGSRVSVYMALSHEDAVRERRKTVTPRPEGAAAHISTIYERGGAELQRYLNHAQHRQWANELLSVNSAALTRDQAPEAADVGVPAEEIASDKQEVDPCKVKLTNVPRSATEEELVAALGKYGAVRDAVICTNPLTSEPSGVAFVTFRTPGGCSNLLRRKQELLVHGVFVRLTPAAMEEHSEHSGLRRRAFDRHNTLAWRTLHQNSQNIVAQLAERTGTSTELVQNDAVLLAAGEALLNRELVDRMRQRGIRQDGPRSRNAILVKNIPPDVVERDILALFAQFGTVITCDLFFPGFCLVVFAQSHEARKAFNKLAFRKIGKAFVPLMLEFAIMTDGEVQTNTQDAQGTLDTEKTQGDAPIKQDSPEQSKTIHIKSISFQTSETKFQETLKDSLQSDLLACNLVQGLHNNKGYGFAVVKANQLSSCIGKINKIICDGFKWDASEAIGKNKKTNDRESINTNKLIIKNIAFQTSTKELRQLLNQFGRVVGFRTPRKLDNSLRGFAFVEYATEKEAIEAMNYIGQTHFYGRHLIVEPSYEKVQGEDQDMVQDLL